MYNFIKNIEPLDILIIFVFTTIIIQIIHNIKFLYDNHQEKIYMSNNDDDNDEVGILIITDGKETEIIVTDKDVDNKLTQ